MESRLKEVDHCFNSKTQKKFNKEHARSCRSMGQYGFLRTPIWVPEDQIKKKMFKDSGALQPMKMEFLDIPLVYWNTAAGFDFIYALNKCEDINVFALKSVQIMIGEHH